MSRNIPTNSDSMEYARQQVKKNCKQAILDSIVILLDRIEDAENRIEEEGIVVRDMKGSVIPHPAIKIAEDSMKLMVSIIDKH